MGEYYSHGMRGGEINHKNVRAYLSLRVTFKLTHQYRTEMLKKLSGEISEKKATVGSTSIRVYGLQVTQVISEIEKQIREGIEHFCTLNYNTEYGFYNSELELQLLKDRSKPAKDEKCRMCGETGGCLIF